MISLLELITRRRTETPEPALVSTTDLPTLPEVTLTPGERAWDAYRSIKNNPGCWKQVTYGQLEGGRVVGCFAHHLVRRAGYEIVAPYPGSSYRDQVRIGELRASLPQLAHDYGCYSSFHDHMVPVDVVAERLLGLSYDGRQRLFSGSNGLARVHKLLTDMYGPETNQH